MPHTKTSKGWAVLDNILAVFEEVKKHDPEMPFQRLALFIIIARSGPVQFEKLAGQLGLSRSGISRNISALGKWGFKTKAGLEWVETDEDPNERRRKLVFLSNKGQKVLARFLEVAEGTQHKENKTNADQTSQQQVSG